MDWEAADRISAAASRDPESETAVSGFAGRAATAADVNDPQDDDGGWDDWDEA